MSIFSKIKKWLNGKKNNIIIGGTFILTLIGTGVCYVLYKNDKVSFSDWLKIATKEDLEEAYEKLRLHFCKTGIKPFGMEQISHELGIRGAKEWFEKYPSNLDPNFRWTDANRWDRD